MRAAGTVLIALALAACSDNKPGSSPPASAPAVETPKGWSYWSAKDEVAGTVRRLACVTSDEEVKQAAPYSDTHVRLCVRFQDAKLNAAYVTLEDKGQLLCDIPRCHYTVRFDDAAPQKMEMGGSTDFDSTVMFFASPAPVYRAIRAHHVLRVKVPLYESGQQNVLFNLDGLAPDPSKWESPKP